MAKKKRKRRRGPKEERLKINMDWEDAARLIVTKKTKKSEKPKK